MAAAAARAGALVAAAAVALGAATGAAAGWTAAERAALARAGRASPALVEALDAADEVPVIVALAAAPDAAGAARADAVLARLGPHEFRLARRHGALRAFSGRATRPGLLRLLASPEVVAVDLDRPVHPLLGEAVPMTGMADLQVEGHTGAGQVIAVIDTGVASGHEDLTGAVIAERCFCEGAAGPAGCCPNGLDSQSGPGAGADDHGHGTGVAGVLASNGSSAPVGGAPGASLVSVKVLPGVGSGTVADLLDGLAWVLARDDVTVVNLSLGVVGPYAGDCDGADATTMALSDAVAQLRAQGVPAVAGSGNSGSGTQMVAPACVADAISVGAVWDAALGSQSWLGCTDPVTAPDLVACFTNSGPTTDLMAPGGLIETSWFQGGITLRAGTSYAAPMVSACAALILAARPGLHPEAVAGALELSPTLVTDATNGLSFPRLECAESLHAVWPVPALPPAGPVWLAALLLSAAAGALARVRLARARAAGGLT